MRWPETSVGSTLGVTSLLHTLALVDSSCPPQAAGLINAWWPVPAVPGCHLPWPVLAPATILRPRSLINLS